ncbi:hypothetical protein MBM_08804 [Drepanopeziza brunnea f. sp. 'multigermtubi' MB_m1]|uniref:Uncharacterized protein n=1 Tax=Marssonina brunnea f. sp. multigermtubi (strain MB_m1) TaxID=1072389 RepID=K1WLB2_MARBU|nr:uncharacterized protein MBM_08804 [Drepanopeziza brunnea f. sp. 'multigermtubi' MB_m1]EKD13042.1 hypothetical protein MBM_08804 [Drepanopeziza brunnea f. sp. 'multigermtubi' MB_m1]
MLLSTSICATLLALSFCFSKAEADDNRKVIGYRTVAKVHRDEAFDNEDFYLNSIGFGVYMVQEPAGWFGQESDWYCVIRADIEKIDSIDKAWIPLTWEKENEDGKVEKIELYGEEELTVEYIRSLMIPEPEKALRLSTIDDEGSLQMLIPTKVVNSGVLDLWAICFETPEKLAEFSNEFPEWDDWDIKGESEAAFM